MITEEQLNIWGQHLLFKLNKGTYEEQLYLKFLHGIITRIKSNDDCVICVCGERNSGKSSFAIVSALGLKQLGLNFDMSNIFYGRKDLNKAMRKIHSTRNSVFVFDEMIDFAYSMDAMTMLNKAITKTLSKTRKLNHVYFFCIPRFKNLSSTIRNAVVHFWVEVFWKSTAEDRDKKSALAALFRKDKNPISIDPWGIEETTSKFKLTYLKRSVLSSDDLEKLMKRIKSFICVLKFPPIPLPIEQNYETSARDFLKDTNDEYAETKPI